MYKLPLDSFLFFYTLYSLPLTATSYRETRRVCLVEIQSTNSSFDDQTYKEVICYNSWCCRNGCCAWSFNISTVLFCVVVLLIVGRVIKECWRRHCPPVLDTTVLPQPVQENIVMTSINQSVCGLTRNIPPNYGSNNDVPSYPVQSEDGLPTYEEAMYLNTQSVRQEI